MKGERRGGGGRMGEGKAGEVGLVRGKRWEGEGGGSR